MNSGSFPICNKSKKESWSFPIQNTRKNGNLSKFQLKIKEQNLESGLFQIKIKENPESWTSPI